MNNEIKINIKIFYYLIKRLNPRLWREWGSLVITHAPEQIDGVGGP